MGISEGEGERIRGAGADKRARTLPSDAISPFQARLTLLEDHHFALAPHIEHDTRPLFQHVGVEVVVPQQ